MERTWDQFEEHARDHGMCSLGCRIMCTFKLMPTTTRACVYYYGGADNVHLLISCEVLSSSVHECPINALGGLGPSITKMWVG
jgi:hypothetical protein